jgi:hypothetical protein
MELNTEFLNQALPCVALILALAGMFYADWYYNTYLPEVGEE